MDPYSKLVKKPLTFKRITGLDLHEFHTIIAKLRPIFQRKYLKKKKGGFLWFDSIKWNFTKFLVDKEGNVVQRFSPSTNPHKLEEDIEKLL